MMKPIKGYEGYYSITNNGRIWSHKRTISSRNQHGSFGSKLGGYWMKTRLDKDGYLIINLCKNNKCKTKKIHRLVAKTFISNPHNKPCINHKDGNKQNNDYTNLEWVTHKENTTHAIKNRLINQNGENSINAKLTWDQANEMRKKHIPIKSYREKVWEQYNISIATYYGVVNGTKWNDLENE